MDHAKVFDSLKKDFCALWKFKVHGDTLEIITNFSTTTDQFISVFITQRNQFFVVTDGGWISDQVYECRIDPEDPMYDKLFRYYEKYFEIQTLENGHTNYYYKKSRDEKMIGAMVYDLANFISNVCSGSQINFETIKEINERRIFTKHANDYLKSFETKRTELKVRLRERLPDTPTVIFSAIARKGMSLKLINYVTGSDRNYFLGSIGKAELAFKVADKTGYSNYINSKVAFVNDKASGFSNDKFAVYLDVLRDVTNNQVVFWHEKEKMGHILLS